MLRKYLVALLMGLLLVQAARSQPILVDKAAEYLKRKELNDARVAIDLAVKNESTNQDIRAWSIRGFVYKELYKAAPATVEYRETALASLQRCNELDIKGMYKQRNASVFEYLYGTYYNESVDYLNKKDFTKALAGFQKFINYRANSKPDGYYAEALYNAGYASYITSNYTQARGYYEDALKLNFSNPYLYDDLTQIYQKLGEKNLAIKTIEAGRKKYPADPSLRITEINLYLYLHDYLHAETKLEEYIVVDPNNIDAMLVAGTVYETIARSDTTKSEKYFLKRKEIYKKILLREPDNPYANYNMAITLYNRAVDLLDVEDNLRIDILEFNAKLEVVTRLFQEALPYAEKAAQLAPKNKNTLKALQGIYHFLSEEEKEREITSQIKDLKG